MTITARRLVTAAFALAVAVSLLAGAPAATAAPDDTVVLTSQQLTDVGFPTTPNTTAWGGGTASLPTNSAAPWQDVIITGKAPSYTQPGQVLTMFRYVATSTTGDGRLKPLNITTVVKTDRSFSLHFQLGYSGTWGYEVGYNTGGPTPEQVGFQFQFTTTGPSTLAPKGSAFALSLTAKQLARAGFTRTPNVVGWGGTATISAHRARAGAPVTLTGTAPKELAAGTVLTLQRFVPTDKRGSGSFVPVGDVITTVQSDGTFALAFELNEPGRYGYSLGAPLNQQWLGIEFQLKTT
jgi:hypothetical protein